MVLDFSQPNFNHNKLTIKSDFEQSIVDFLKQWYDSNSTIQVQTSGSTGKPKKFDLLKSNMIKSAQLTGKYLDLKKADTALLALPMSYIAGKMMVVRAIVLGLKLICIEPKSQIKWVSILALDPHLKHLDFVALTPMQVEKSLDFIPFIQKLIIGGAPLSSTVKAQLLSTENDIYETYAMTETITHIAFKKIANKKNQQLNDAFEVFDEITIGQDDRGCLTIATPYEKTILVTNDVVTILDEKHFLWLGRADHVINSGGIKLFPEQIENKLKPFIAQDFYISYREDESLGQKLLLVVEGKPTKLDFAEASLSKFERPKEIIFVQQFERTTSGKIRRKVF